MAAAPAVAPVEAPPVSVPHVDDMFAGSALSFLPSPLDQQDLYNEVNTWISQKRELTGQPSLIADRRVQSQHAPALLAHARVQHRQAPSLDTLDIYSLESRTTTRYRQSPDLARRTVPQYRPAPTFHGRDAKQHRQSPEVLLAHRRATLLANIKMERARREAARRKGRVPRRPAPPLPERFADMAILAGKHGLSSSLLNGLAEMHTTSAQDKPVTPHQVHSAPSTPRGRPRPQPASHGTRYATRDAPPRPGAPHRATSPNSPRGLQPASPGPRPKLPRSGKPRHAPQIHGHYGIQVRCARDALLQLKLWEEEQARACAGLDTSRNGEDPTNNYGKRKGALKGTVLPIGSYPKEELERSLVPSVAARAGSGARAALHLVAAHLAHLASSEAALDSFIVDSIAALHEVLPAHAWSPPLNLGTHDESGPGSTDSRQCEDDPGRSC